MQCGFSGVFRGTKITKIPPNLFANCANATDFRGVFSGTKITEIQSDLFANCPNVTDFSLAFSDTGITEIPPDLFSNCPNVIAFYGTFAGCVNLMGRVPELWNTGTNSKSNNYKGNPRGNGCFSRNIN